MGPTFTQNSDLKVLIGILKVIFHIKSNFQIENEYLRSLSENLVFCCSEISCGLAEIAHKNKKGQFYNKNTGECLPYCLYSTNFVVYLRLLTRGVKFVPLKCSIEFPFVYDGQPVY